MNKKDFEKLEDAVRDLYEKFDLLSKFVEILMLGHKTERKHKNIFNRMFRQLTKINNRQKEAQNRK